MLYSKSGVSVSSMPPSFVLETGYKPVSLCRVVCKKLMKAGKRLNILVHMCFKGRTGETECLGSPTELGEHVWY